MTNSVATFVFKNGDVLYFDATWDDDGFIDEGEDIGEDVYFTDHAGWNDGLKSATIKRNDGVEKEIHFQSETGMIYTYPIK